MKRELALRTWRRAAESLGAAESLARMGYNADAVSRAYYAVFYAARAATCAADIPESRTHKGAIYLFREHLVLTGGLEHEWAEKFALAYTARHNVDYEILSAVSADDAAMRCSDARLFVERMRKYLLDMGLTVKELDSAAACDNP